MELTQAFKNIRKPVEIEQSKIDEYLSKLYGSLSFDAEDKSYVDGSNEDSVKEYKERVTQLIEKLVEISGNEKFNQLKEQFDKNVLVGATRTILDKVKKTAEAMCYKLEHVQITSQEKI